jgi:hypothetical protein
MIVISQESWGKKKQRSSGMKGGGGKTIKVKIYIVY